MSTNILTRNSGPKQTRSSKSTNPRRHASALGDPVAEMDVRAHEDISSILVDWKRYPSPVRPVGSDSATTRCNAASGGTLVRLAGMNRILRITTESVTVQPGVRIGELAEALAEHGLELPCGSDVADRTIGGVVAAPALQAGLPVDGGQLAGHVLSLKLIAPGGRKLEVSQRNARLLSMIRLSYGLLGVIYEITLRVRKIRGFSVQHRKCDFTTLSGLVPKLVQLNAGVKFWLLPFRDRVYLELRRADAKASEGRRLSWRIKEWAAYTALPSFARSLSRSIPLRQLRYPIIDRFSEATQGLVSATLTQSGSNSIEQTGKFRRLEVSPTFKYCTWVFPHEQFPQTLMAYRYFCREYYQRTGFRCDMPAIGHRLNQDNSALLSPSFHTPMMSITSMSTDQRGWEDFVLGLDEFAQQHAGMPFFNQTKGASVERVNAAFDTRLPFFRKVRAQFDPDDRMLNQYFAGLIA
ncbi:MAG: FAD-binding oxidoreductase [Gammaproteobacteria bacterium]